MEKLIATVKELHGDFILRTSEGQIEMLDVGDQVHEHDTVAGMQWNTPEHKLLLSLDGYSGEIVLHADSSIILDAETIAASPSLIENDLATLSTDISDASQKNDSDDAHTTISEDIPVSSRSEGISTSEFTTHELSTDNVIAHLIDTLKEPLMADESLDFTTAQNIAGIMDISSAIHAADAPMIISDPNHKSVHKDVMQAAIDNTDADRSAKHAIDDTVFGDDGTLIGTIDSIDDAAEAEMDAEISSAATIFEIDYDEISMSLKESQLTDDEMVKTLSIEDVLEITPEEKFILRINGDSSDTVGLEHDLNKDGTVVQWTKATDSLLDDDGNVYDVYTGTNGEDTVTLQIDQNVIVTDF